MSKSGCEGDCENEIPPSFLAGGGHKVLTYQIPGNLQLQSSSSPTSSPMVNAIENNHPSHANCHTLYARMGESSLPRTVIEFDFLNHVLYSANLVSCFN